MSDLIHSSIPDLLRSQSSRYSDFPALSYKKEGKFIQISYSDFYKQALMVARGLNKKGLEPGDKVAILAENRFEWVVADMGIMISRCISVPIYATDTPKEIKHILKSSGASAIFLSNKTQYEKLVEIKDEINKVEHIFSFDQFLATDEKFPLNSLYQLMERSIDLSKEEKEKLEQEINKINLEDIMTIIYTSGTTNHPKGVMLTYKNLLSEITSALRKFNYNWEDEVFLSFLPLSHALERSVGYYIPVYQHATIAFAENIQTVPQDMQNVQPTMMVCVPRLFEKIYDRIKETIHQKPKFIQVLLKHAFEIGNEYIKQKYLKKETFFINSFLYHICDFLFFRKIRQRFGGKIKLMVSGGAPLDESINLFFWTIGIPVLEGYGLTETSPAISMNTMEDLKFGSVGKVFDNTEVKINSDGELLIKSPMVMKGYFDNPEATEATFEGDWLKTGDIAKVDEDGFVFITDRKKELIITAGGKNIAPLLLENKIRLDNYITQACVFGDKKAYLTALIIPNFERLVTFAKKRKLVYFDIADLVHHEKIQRLLQHRIDLINSELASYETIKKFNILPREFSIEGGELTPTMKIKRRVVYEKYKERIDELYD